MLPRVKFTLQPAVPSGFASNWQLDGLIEPAPVVVKTTEPVGVCGLPIVELSLTTTVHVEAWLMTTGLVQVTVVALERLLIVTLPPTVVWLALWSVSVGTYTPFTVAVPVEDPVKVTEQLDALADAEARMHDWADRVPETPAAEKLTEPGGGVAPAPLESATVAVHCDD